MSDLPTMKTTIHTASTEPDLDAFSSRQHPAAELAVPKVTWYKEPGLRKLYCMMPIFFLGSTLTGYDGSLLNGLQTMQPWQQCKID